jgi:hypothetical protein
MVASLSQELGTCARALEGVDHCVQRVNDCKISPIVCDGVRDGWNGRSRRREGAKSVLGIRQVETHAFLSGTALGSNHLRDYFWFPLCECWWELLFPLASQAHRYSKANDGFLD